MGLFKKKSKEEIKTNTQTINTDSTINQNNIVKPEIKNEPKETANIQTVQTNIESQKPEIKTTTVEVLNLENNEKKLKTKIEKKKDLTFLIYVFGIVIVFVICMPIIRDFFVPKAKIVTTTTEKESDNLEFGYIVIGKEKSYMKKENIKFYKFTKYENNNIVFNYMADKAVRDANLLNIYIVVYNKYGSIVHKEKFNQKELIKKETENSYSFALSSLTYKEAVYIKIDIIPEELREKEIVCKSSTTSNNIKLNNEISYKFVDGMLVSYSLIQKFETEADASKIKDNYKKIYDTLKKTNIASTNLVLNDNSIYYKIDYTYFDKGEVNFNLRYVKNDYIDYIKTIETKRDWTCE